MRPSTGSVTTLLMFVPLIAVPLLAVFGIPQFSAVNASPPGDEEAFTLAPARDAKPGSTARRGDDPFASAGASFGASADFSRYDVAGDEHDRAPAAHAPRTDEAEVDPFHAADESETPPATTSGPGPRRGSMSGWAVDPGRPNARSGRGGDIQPTSTSTAAARLDALGEGDAAPADETPFKRAPVRLASNPAGGSARPEPAGRAPREADSGNPFDSADSAPSRPAASKPPLTWRGAVDRLNELGIRDFQLQPGVRGDEFHFSCWFTPDDNPRTSIRFEAEAGEPLTAVKEVIAQIEARFQSR